MSPGETVDLINQSYEAALSLFHEGRYPAALVAIESLLNRDSAEPDLLALAAASCFSMGRKADAVTYWARVIALRPADARMHSNLGLALRELGRLAEAEEVLRRALSIDPSSDSAHNNLGLVLFDLGRFYEAEAAFRLALASAPASAESARNLGLTLHASGRLADAEYAFRQALEIAPGYAAAYNDLGRLFRDLDRLPEARQAFMLALASDAAFSAARSNLGLVLRELGHLDEAESAYRHALTLSPDSCETLNDLGIVLYERGELEHAISYFERAVALAPAAPKMQRNLAYALLAAGNYEQAWPHLEARLNEFPGANATPDTTLALPRWEGGAPPSGAGILVLHEEGLGDALQFCRYLLILRSRCSHVGYVCPAPLRRLFDEALCSRWPNLTMLDVVPKDLTAWDSYCSLLSLPMLLDTHRDNIPAPVPYICADPQRAGHWRHRLITLDGNLPKVGIVWAGGNSGTAADARRSIAPDTFAKLFSWAGAYWISLQKADAPSKRLPPRYHAQVIDCTDELNDFADTAALVDGLDLVISVDTSVAHLAAAMGKPVWLMNRYAGCWRWLRDREDSPWYPGLRLFTQVERGNWDEVLMRIRCELEQWCATRSAR